MQALDMTIENTETKGQLFSVELVLASAVFMGALVAFVLVWNSMSAAYNEEQADLQMQTSLLGISDMAVLSPGYPANWETGVLGNASSFGLATSPNVLSGAKAGALQSLNSSYLDMKERMGAGRFDVFLSIGNSTGTFYTFGYAPDLNDTTVKAISSQRVALLNGSAVSVKVQLWRIKGKVL